MHPIGAATATATEKHSLLLSNGSSFGFVDRWVRENAVADDWLDRGVFVVFVVCSGATVVKCVQLLQI